MAHALTSYHVVIQEDVDATFIAIWTPGVGGLGTPCRIEDAPDPIAALKRLATQLRVEDDRRAMLNAIDSQGDPC